MPKIRYHLTVQTTQPVDVDCSVTQLTYTKTAPGQPARVAFTFTPDNPLSGFPPRRVDVVDDPDGGKPTQATDIITLIERAAVISALTAAAS